METIDVTAVAPTTEKVRCDCGYDMSILPPDRTWRTVKCTCGTIWWVKPSGRRFEKHKEYRDMEY